MIHDALAPETVPFSGIEKAIVSVLRRVAEAGFEHAARANVVAFEGGAAGEEWVTPFLSAFMRVRPSRLFRVVTDDGGPGSGTATVSAACHAVSPSTTVCSETIVLRTDLSGLAAVRSVVDGVAISAAPTELLLLDPRPSQEILGAFSRFIDTVLFDSGRLEDPWRATKSLMSLFPTLLDLRWAAIAEWRSAVRTVFDGAGGAPSADRIVRCTVSGVRPPDVPAGPEEFLTAGWFLSRLGLEPVSVTKLGFECRSGSGHEVLLRIRREAPTGERAGGMTSFSCRYETASGPAKVKVRRGPDGALSLWSDSPAGFRSTQPSDPSDPDALLERFFLVGESLSNYPAALRTAAQLEELSRAYAAR